MGRQFLPLTVDRLPLLIEPCSTCLFWERTPAQSLLPAPDPADVKRTWLQEVLQEWGSAGRIALVDRTPAGFVTYAPAHLVPRAMAFPTAPVSGDAVALITARIAGEYSGQGLGKALLQRAARDVLRHGVRAIEVFATTAPPRPMRFSLGGRARVAGHQPRPSEAAKPAQEGAQRDEHERRSVRAQSQSPARLGESRAAAPASIRGRSSAVVVISDATRAPSWAQSASGDDTDRARGSGDATPDGTWRAFPGSSRRGEENRFPNAWGPQHCLLPVDFLTAVGFYPVREHPVYPRMRLDLRTALRWREEVGLAVERLFARPVASRRPVGTVN